MAIFKAKLELQQALDSGLVQVQGLPNHALLFRTQLPTLEIQHNKGNRRDVMS